MEVLCFATQYNSNTWPWGNILRRTLHQTDQLSLSDTQWVFQKLVQVWPRQHRRLTYSESETCRLILNFLQALVFLNLLPIWVLLKCPNLQYLFVRIFHNLLVMFGFPEVFASLCPPQLVASLGLPKFAAAVPPWVAPSKARSSEDLSRSVALQVRGWYGPNSSTLMAQIFWWPKLEYLEPDEDELLKMLKMLLFETLRFTSPGRPTGS